MNMDRRRVIIDRLVFQTLGLLMVFLSGYWQGAVADQILVLPRTIFVIQFTLASVGGMLALFASDWKR